MKISQTSQWNETQINKFLTESEFPIRLGFLNKENEPNLCSLWYEYENGAIWCASHKSSYLIKQLKINSVISFEVSSNDYPYKGVRGKAEVKLSMTNASEMLNKLISKYLGNSNTSLSSWLLSRSDDEYIIKVNPTFITSWDFSSRMKK